jgi:hypothetical protein
MLMILGVLFALLPLGIEATRWAAKPAVSVDGWTVDASDPFPVDLHRDQRVELRRRRVRK